MPLSSSHREYTRAQKRPESVKFFILCDFSLSGHWKVNLCVHTYTPTHRHSCTKTSLLLLWLHSFCGKCVVWHCKVKENTHVFISTPVFSFSLTYLLLSRLWVILVTALCDLETLKERPSIPIFLDVCVCCEQSTHN